MELRADTQDEYHIRLVGSGILMRFIGSESQSLNKSQWVSVGLSGSQWVSVGLSGSQSQSHCTSHSDSDSNSYSPPPVI